MEHGQDQHAPIRFVEGLTYQRLKGHCDAEGSSVSGWLEDLIAEKLDALGVPEQTELLPRQPRPTPEVDADIISQHFTF